MALIKVNYIDANGTMTIVRETVVPDKRQSESAWKKKSPDQFALDRGFSFLEARTGVEPV
jgi:hypothetical protein